jgi:hypothetical protein
MKNDDIGWFRTPIAAGMLSGILFAIVYQAAPRLYPLLQTGEAFAVCFVALGTVIVGTRIFLSSSKRTPRAIYGALRGGVLLSLGTFVAIAFSLGMNPIGAALVCAATNGAYLCGPAITQRSLMKFIDCMFLALVVAILMALGWSILIPLAMKTFPFGGYIAFLLALSAVFGMLLCRSLCGLYELRERRWLIYIVAAVSAVLAYCPQLVDYYLRQKNARPVLLASQEYEVFKLMAALILNMQWVLVPTILIERELRKQAAADAVTSPAAPATSPTESDASSAMR